MNQFDLESLNIEKIEEIENKPLVGSKKDLFLFHRKKAENLEYIKAKSVVNLDEIKDIDGDFSEEK